MLVFASVRPDHRQLASLFEPGHSGASGERSSHHYVEFTNNDAIPTSHYFISSRRVPIAAESPQRPKPPPTEGRKAPRAQLRRDRPRQRLRPRVGRPRYAIAITTVENGPYSESAPESDPVWWDEF